MLHELSLLNIDVTKHYSLRQNATTALQVFSFMSFDQKKVTYVHVTDHTNQFSIVKYITLSYLQYSYSFGICARIKTEVLNPKSTVDY